MSYSNNPKYKEVFKSEVHGVSFYVPVESGDFHTSRYVAANAQNIYSGAGVTKELLTGMLAEMIKLCQEEKNPNTLRTNMGVMINNLLYRTKFPIDEDCAIRMGAIYAIMDGEDEMYHDLWTQKKMEMCKGSKPDSALYDFFLHTGIIYTPSWNELRTRTIVNMDYLIKRNEQLNALTIQLKQ